MASRAIVRGVADVRDVERWVGAHVKPTGPIENVYERPWATVFRTPLAHGTAWCKACAPVQAFEPRLTAELSGRWPDLVPEVLAFDEQRGWLLLADAGDPVGPSEEPSDAWLDALPRYAELQRGEIGHASDHLAHGVPDLRLGTLPSRYEELLTLDPPLEREEIRTLHDFAPRFRELCVELASHGVPATIQHDDLHHANLYVDGDHVRILDWGDASISHPFASLVVTFRFLEERARLPPGDPWFARLMDAYLAPWGPGFRPAFRLAIRAGAFARAIAYLRQRAALEPDQIARFDTDFSIVLRRALVQTEDPDLV